MTARFQNNRVFIRILHYLRYLKKLFLRIIQCTCVVSNIVVIAYQLIGITMSKRINEKSRALIVFALVVNLYILRMSTLYMIYLFVPLFVVFFIYSLYKYMKFPVKIHTAFILQFTFFYLICLVGAISSIAGKALRSCVNAKTSIQHSIQTSLSLVLNRTAVNH